MNAEEYWPNCDCKTYSKSPQKTKKVWDRVKKLCRAKNRRDLEIQRLKLRAQQKIKAGKKPEALVILREMKRLKDMKLTDYIDEKESAKLARVGANSGGRRRRRRRRRTRRGRGKGTGTDKFGRQLGTRRKRDAAIRARRRAHPVQPLVHRRVAQLRTGFSWAQPSAEARKFKADMQGLGLGLEGLTFSRGQNSPKSSPKSSKRKSIKKRGGRRRTRRRRGGMNPPKVTVAKIEAGTEAEWKRRQNIMIARAAAEKSASDIQKILKKAAQEEVEAAAKRQS